MNKNKIDVSELRGPLGELLDQFSGDSALERFEKFKLWQKGVEFQLLRLVTTVSVDEAKRFVASERLQAANVGWTGENFKRLFLDKIEKNVPDGQIAIHSLVKGSLDPEIMVELGRARRVIRLAHFFQMLERQAKGQAGPLLTSGAVNVAYCVGNDGNVWAVYADWDSVDRYWYVVASSIGYPYEWHAGYQVLSQAA